MTDPAFASPHSVLPTNPPAGAAVLNQTKFHPPQSSRSGVPRESLLNRLEQEANVHLVLLRAPAGYGKTTLMRQWMERIASRDGHAAWLTLDESDNDPARLMGYLFGALGNWMAVALGNESAATSASADWMAVLDRIGPDAPPLTLFLDEFEQLSSDPALRIARLLVERLPRLVRLVISTRDKPSFGVERYRVRGELLEITARDLRFDNSETLRFFSGRTGQAPAAWLVEKIQSITDGWPAALQLTALAAHDQQDLERYASDLSGSLAHIADYLAEDVLNAQPPNVRAFLLETCGFPRLSATVCNAATGRTDSQHMLQYLERHGLFTTALDASHTWFRYHPLFAEFLRGQQAELLPREQIVATHRGAARWFARQRHAIEAVDLWLQAGDNDAAVREMASCARELVMQAQFGIILRWIERLDDAVLSGAGPELPLAAAWACGFGGNPATAIEWLARAKQLLGGDEDDIAVRDEADALESILMALRGETRQALQCGLAHWKHVSKAQRFATGALANVISYCLMLEGDFIRAREFSNTARLCNEEIGSMLGLGYALSVSGLLEAIQGNLDRSLEQLREVGKMAALRLRRPSFETSHVNIASVGLIASVLYEKDQLDEAEELLQRYLPLVMHQPSVDMLLLSQLVHVRLKLAQGDHEAAFEALDQAHLCTGDSWEAARARRLIEWERVRIELLLDRRDQALARADLLERTSSGGDNGYTYVEELYGRGIELIRCAIARDVPRTALVLLEREVEQAASQGRRWRLLKLLLLRTLALDAHGDRLAAQAALANALALGWRLGARRSFAEEGKRLATLLRDLPASAFAAMPDADAVAAYWKDLRGDASPAATPAMALNMPLNDRERAILQLLATGLSNEQVAARVFLSVNTVKWHIRRILEKLDARNRSEAVFLARQHGLIEL
ncbi:MAG TPA: LuxR C-terminal-related transcriptional regulator [Noviherbaspirillum sp.]|nr:LuxR C-terminal-related transcriptional regulator [Noviherbaspirillum sp.]